MRISRISFLVILWMTSIALPVRSAELSLASLLPAPACADGWVLDGKVTLFDKDTLFDRINGESELYFPYGFTTLAYGRYESKKDAQIALDADVYAMGSLLDAFGVFANYRRKDDAAAPIGVEGVISPSQLLFYQDRFLVRIQITGATTADQSVLLACGKAVSQKLPPGASRPKELDAFALPGVIRNSERYIASSLLGYEFFRSGIIAGATAGNDTQIFLVWEASENETRAAFEKYRGYLRAGAGPSLEGSDPLYGAVVARRCGRFIAGAVRVQDVKAAKQIVDQVLEGAGKIAHPSSSTGEVR